MFIHPRKLRKIAKKGIFIDLAHDKLYSLSRYACRDIIIYIIIIFMMFIFIVYYNNNIIIATSSAGSVYN